MLSVIVELQILYALVGSAYNLVSIVRVRRGRKPLSATNPMFGMVIMAVVAGVTLSQPYLGGLIYGIGWSILVVMLAKGPVTSHFKAIISGHNLAQYSSWMAAFLAFSINLFGLIAGCIGVVMTAANFIS